MGVIRPFRQSEEKPSVRDHRFGKAAVSGPAVKLSVRAKVFLAAPTKRTEPTGKAQPSRADPHARRERWDAAPTPATRPTTSWPGTTLGARLGKSPSTTCRSVRQTPQAQTSMTTSVGCSSFGQEPRRPTSGTPTASQTIAEYVSGTELLRLS